MRDLHSFNQNLHIWQIDLPLSKIELDIFSDSLSKEEFTRMQKYLFEKDKIRFLAGRGALRNILGRYTGIAPKAIQFEENKYGKPFLRSDFELTLKKSIRVELKSHLGSALCNESAQFHFNLSHSEQCILIAISPDAPVGIDVEFLNPNIDEMALSRQFFSETEFHQLQALQETERKLGFYRLWTRKEAFIKALGLGLSFPLNEVIVNVLPGQEASLVSVQGSKEEASQWTLCELQPKKEYIGAVAIKKKIQHVEWKAWFPLSQEPPVFVESP